jgi:hypothetical protein
MFGFFLFRSIEENKMFEVPDSLRRSAGLLVLSAVLSGCATGLKAPTQEQVRQLKNIDVVVSVPPSNFSYRSNGGTVYAQPSAGMSVGAGIGINIAANLIFAGIDYAITATAREAQVPVGKSVEDLDLRKATFSQLQTFFTGIPAAPNLKLSDQAFPKLDARPSLAAAFASQAKASEADATLFVMLRPSFLDIGGYAVMKGNYWLVNRNGETLLETNTDFVGPADPKLERAEVVRWWADGRYRRFILQGLRAGMIPVADGLLKPALDEAQKAQAEQRIKGLPRSHSNAVTMTSTPCAVEADDTRVVYRFEREMRNFRVAAYCPNETLKLWDSALVPEVSWVTELQPALIVPPVRMSSP